MKESLWGGINPTAVSVIRQKSPNDYESVGDIATQKSAKTMAFDPKSKRLFLSAAEMVSAAGRGAAEGEAREFHDPGG